MQGEIRLHHISTSLFSLKHTFESAQPLTFYADYNAASNTIIYPAQGSIINIMHKGAADKGIISILSSNPNAEEEVVTRFRLNDNMARIYKKISTDKHVENAINLYKGMRLTINDPWEATLTFIISQFNNVKRIRLITKNIIDRFGAPIFDNTGKIIAKEFPESKYLLGVTEKDFLELGAGFRSKYIREAAEYCTYNINLHKLPKSDYWKLKESLMSIKGIGEKVADCIILMGYGNLEAFPIDVHVKRAMEKLYFKGRKKKLSEIQDFAESEWGKYRGYAQQYLFHNARLTGAR